MEGLPAKILLATDGSEDAARAARVAADIAKRTGSELHVLHVGEHTVSPYYTEMIEKATQEAEELLDEQVKQIEDRGGSVAGAHVRLSHPDEKIITLAEELGAGLIVVGSRGFNPIKRVLLGSVSDSVVRHAHCPVLVVRGESGGFPGRILVATDGSEEAALAARTAAALAATAGSELHVVHVGEFLPTFLSQTELEPAQVEREARGLLDEQAARLGANGKPVADTHLRLGAADREIVAVAEEIGADLIAMGSRGRGGIRRALMGSVSDSVVRHAHCPVLVVRPQEDGREA